MNLKKLFPFDVVAKESRILIYGWGDYGRCYAEQIKITHWCHIVAISDRNKKESEYQYVKPSEIKNISDLDYIIIAMENIENSYEVYNYLLDQGIDVGQIWNNNMLTDKSPITYSYASNAIIKIRCICFAGFGDLLLTLLLIQKMKEVFDGKIEITMATKLTQYVSLFDFVDNVENYDKHVKEFDEHNFDICLVVDSNSVLVKYMNQKKIEILNKKLYEYCRSVIENDKRIFGGIIANNTYQRVNYNLLHGLNRIEGMDPLRKLGLGRQDVLKLPQFYYTHEDIKELLTGNCYITINRDMDIRKIEDVKLWPIEYYVSLINMIKNKYNSLKIVLIGNRCADEIREVADVDLTGRTTLSDLHCILRNSKVHIGSEGGLIHLNHFLGGKSLVIFGPTNPEYFGYTENINISNNVCPIKCEWLVKDWFERCARGDEYPRCLYSISPKAVMQQLEENVFNKIYETMRL